MQSSGTKRAEDPPLETNASKPKCRTAGNVLNDSQKRLMQVADRRGAESSKENILKKE